MSYILKMSQRAFKRSIKKLLLCLVVMSCSMGGYEETWGFRIKLVQFWHTWHRHCPVVKGDLLIQTRHTDNWGSSWRGLLSLRCRLYHLQSCVCVTLLITIIVRVIISPIVTRVGVCVGGHCCTWVIISISDLVKKRNGSLFSLSEAQ